MNVLYSENDWVYVVSDEDKEGFIPNSYCAAYGTQQASLILNMKKKMPRGNMFIGDPGPGPGMRLLPIKVGNGKNADRQKYRVRHKNSYIGLIMTNPL